VFDESLLLEATERVEDKSLAAIDLFPEIVCGSCNAGLWQARPQGGFQLIGRPPRCGIGSGDDLKMRGGVHLKAQGEGIWCRSAPVLKGEDEFVLAAPDDQVRVGPCPKVAAPAKRQRGRRTGSLAAVVDL